MGPSLFAESLGNAVEKSGQEAYFASCDFCFVHFLNQEQVSFFFNRTSIVTRYSVTVQDIANYVSVYKISTVGMYFLICIVSAETILFWIWKSKGHST